MSRKAGPESALLGQLADSLKIESSMRYAPRNSTYGVEPTFSGRDPHDSSSAGLSTGPSSGRDTPLGGPSRGIQRSSSTSAMPIASLNPLHLNVLTTLPATFDSENHEAYLAQLMNRMLAVASFQAAAECNPGLLSALEEHQGILWAASKPAPSAAPGPPSPKHPAPASPSGKGKRTSLDSSNHELLGILQRMELQPRTPGPAAQHSVYSQLPATALDSEPPASPRHLNRALEPHRPRKYFPDPVLLGGGGGGAGYPLHLQPPSTAPAELRTAGASGREKEKEKDAGTGVAAAARGSLAARGASRKLLGVGPGTSFAPPSGTSSKSGSTRVGSSHAPAQDPLGFSFLAPDIYTLQGAGSFAMQKKVLDLAKKQNETMKNESKTDTKIKRRRG